MSIKWIIRNRRTLLLAAAATGISFANSVSAGAQSTSTATEPAALYACYVPGSGAVYRIKLPGLPEECNVTGRHEHIEFSWTDGAGAVRDGEVVTLAGKVTVDQQGGLLGEGSLGSGHIPAQGAGVRMMWYPAKAAFRAGSARTTEWDDSNIGEHSVAFGQHPIASGPSSFAAGFVAKATGGASVALGPQAEAAGFGSFAQGSLSRASGDWSVVLGQAARATAENAIALGHSANATAEDAAALGPFSRATGVNSVAIGGFNLASGAGSVALGTGSEASGDAAFAFGRQVTASGPRSMAFGNHASTNGMTGALVFSGSDGFNLAEVKAIANNQFVARAQHFWLGSNNAVTAPAGQFLTTSTGAYLTTGGMWTNSSDVNRKEDFRDVDGEEVLARIAALKIQSWSYKDESPSVRHIGPTAQDFHAAFGLGDSETTIGTVDIDGVNLLAIQTLEHRTTELHDQMERVDALEKRVADLEATNVELARRVERLEAALGMISAPDLPR